MTELSMEVAGCAANLVLNRAIGVLACVLAVVRGLPNSTDCGTDSRLDCSDVNCLCTESVTAVL
jgi:hypothetical protein